MKKQYVRPSSEILEVEMEYTLMVGSSVELKIDETTILQDDSSVGSKNSKTDLWEDNE